MTTCLANTQDSASINETDEETAMSSSGDETLGEDFFRPLNPKNEFQKYFGRPTDKRKQPNPTYVT